jgi:hypothetical protein
MVITWGGLQNYFIFPMWLFIASLFGRYHCFPFDVCATLIGRRSFGSVLDVISLADSVTKLTARCELCGKKAFFTLRKTKETQTELIGGADVYMPVCRQHYVNGQVVMEAARSVLESCKVNSDCYLEATSVV